MIKPVVCEACEGSPGWQIWGSCSHGDSGSYGYSEGPGPPPLGLPARWPVHAGRCRAESCLLCMQTFQDRQAQRGSGSVTCRLGEAPALCPSRSQPILDWKGQFFDSRCGNILLAGFQPRPDEVGQPDTTTSECRARGLLAECGSLGMGQAWGPVCSFPQPPPLLMSISMLDQDWCQTDAEATRVHRAGTWDRVASGLCQGGFPTRRLFMPLAAPGTWPRPTCSHGTAGVTGHGCKSQQAGSWGQVCSAIRCERPAPWRLAVWP